jgi:uncharacterized protein YmfQ (DUF2313 family)
MPSDKHVRRGQDDYTAAFAALLPTGIAWPRIKTSILMTVVRALCGIWGQVDGRAADLLERESDPRTTVEILPEWERAWGLPDPCVAEPTTIGDRQKTLVTKMTLLGGQSRPWFIALAATLGYTITIHENAPFMFGISRFGDTRSQNIQRGDFSPRMRWEFGAPEIRFYWTVYVGAVRLTWFRFTVGQFGVDPHLRIALATDLECLFRRYKPAQTEVVFDYSGLGGISNPLQGTP